MEFNASLNNISVISWWSVLLVEETGVTWENHRPVVSHWQTLSLTSEMIIWITRRTSNKKQELLIIHEYLGSPPYFLGRFCVAHLCSFLCCVFCSACLRFISCVQCCPCLWIVHFSLLPFALSNLYFTNSEL